jgi:alpha-L-fucosidase
MTMNDHWGFNKRDTNWKSSAELIRTLADIVSKGGNFLLNVGPTAEGLFPPEAVARLRDIGKWMKVNGEAIYGTDASPFPSLGWGRCTRKETPEGTRLYLHVFDRPTDGKLVVPGIFNAPRGAYLLADASRKPLDVDRREDALVVTLDSAVGGRDARAARDTIDAVVVLDLEGTADVALPPVIDTAMTIFTESKRVAVTSDREKIEIRYTIDGSEPSDTSHLVTGPVELVSTATLSARCFRDGKPVSGTARALFRKVAPVPASAPGDRAGGLDYRYYEGDWDSLPRFDALKAVSNGTLPNFGFGPRRDQEHFAFVYAGYIDVPATGVYTFSTESDDGSRLLIGAEVVVDNDGLHGMARKKGTIALSAGLHPITVEFFEKTGGDGLTISWEGPGIARQAVPDSALFRDR